MNDIQKQELQKLAGMILDLNEKATEYTQALFGSEKGILNNTPESFGWADLYSKPLLHTIRVMISCLEDTDKIAENINTAQSLEELERTLDELDKLAFRDFGQGQELTVYAFLCAWIALIKSIESIQVYGRSLNQLIEDVSQGSDKALFDAVKLDHSVISNPIIRKRISIAELKHDRKFFSRLSNCMKSRPVKYSPKNYRLRFMLVATHEIGLLDQLSQEEAYKLFVIDLQVYGTEGEGDADSLWKFIYRWKKENVQPDN